MRQLLIREETNIVLHGRSMKPTMSGKEWDKTDKNICSAVAFSFLNHGAHQIMLEKTTHDAWCKLEPLHMAKSLMNDNF